MVNAARQFQNEYMQVNSNSNFVSFVQHFLLGIRNRTRSDLISQYLCGLIFAYMQEFISISGETSILRFIICLLAWILAMNLAHAISNRFRAPYCSWTLTIGLGVFIYQILVTMTFAGFSISDWTIEPNPTFGHAYTESIVRFSFFVMVPIFFVVTLVLSDALLVVMSLLRVLFATRDHHSASS